MDARLDPNSLRWRWIYKESELYKAALRVYTKPLFQWRKALGRSTDGKTLYDFAERGLRNLDAIDRALRSERFHFRPSIALSYNFNGKHRTLYIPPWEERIVDLLLYRVLNQQLQHWFSSHSYAYRERLLGLDRCQMRIAGILRAAKAPIYALKRDVKDFFASINHERLLSTLRTLIAPDDYLFHLVKQRIQHAFYNGNRVVEAGRGLPFGCASACVLANVYLTELDRAMESLRDIAYFRYADDVLVLTLDRDAAEQCSFVMEESLRSLRLETKKSHEADLMLTSDQHSDRVFTKVQHLRHLGLLFRCGGSVALSRDKCRKVQNLFRFAFRRRRKLWKKLRDPHERARALTNIASAVIEDSVRNVAIIDYYLKHVDDEQQLQRLDRWLAEEVLSLVFGGHKKGNFRGISFKQLRELGLPSLVHRRRLIRGSRIESPFFVWRKNKSAGGFRGTVARSGRGESAGGSSLSCPEAAAG